MNQDTSWIPETLAIDKKTLLKLAAYAAEYGDEVTLGNRKIYPVKHPEKSLAARQIPGVTFTPHPRTGTATRGRYLDYLSEMFAGGHLDEAEHDARMTAMLKSRTEEELKYLISDLPPMEPPPSPSPRPRPSLLLPLLGMAETGVLGELLKHPLPIPVLAVLVCCLIFWGVVLVIAIAARNGV